MVWCRGTFWGYSILLSGHGSAIKGTSACGHCRAFANVTIIPGKQLDRIKAKYRLYLDNARTDWSGRSPFFDLELSGMISESVALSPRLSFSPSLHTKTTIDFPHRVHALPSARTCERPTATPGSTCSLAGCMGIKAARRVRRAARGPGRASHVNDLFTGSTGYSTARQGPSRTHLHSQKPWHSFFPKPPSRAGGALRGQR